MVNRAKKFFERYVRPSPEEPDGGSEHSLQLATAALLIEMMRADSEVSEGERSMVMKTVMAKFNLTEEESRTLLGFADEKVRKSTGYYEFTSLINRGFNYGQKVKIIEHLWEIAFSDKRLDKHEEHMVRKIADLIYVEHKDFIDAKLRVKKKIKA